MVKARGQAERYIRALPPSEPNPPFLLVVDAGHSFEVFADFARRAKRTCRPPPPAPFESGWSTLRTKRSAIGCPSGSRR